jgi:hypothetical protein
MSFDTLYTDIITQIIYNYNINLTSARLVCSTWKAITDEYGFITDITFGINTPFGTFINLNTKSLRSLKTLTIDSISDPVIWIPNKWPYNTIFNNCSMGYKYIDPPLSHTHILRISDYKSKNPLHINWEKLPDLREIYLNVYDCILDGLINCKNLEVICINSNSNTNIIPSWIGSFKHLNTIITNIKSVSTIHFVSPTLSICLVPKITPFTAISTVVPKENLTNNMYISINDIYQ